MDINKMIAKFNSINEKSKKLDQNLSNLKLLKVKIEKENFFKNTYLESKESIIEMYKLFIFYGLIDLYFKFDQNNCSFNTPE